MTQLVDILNVAGDPSKSGWVVAALDSFVWLILLFSYLCTQNRFYVYAELTETYW